MKYIDLIPKDRFIRSCLTDNRCLVWSCNYETAIFDLEDEVHPESAHIWFQIDITEASCPKHRYIIVKVKVYKSDKDEYKSKLIESCFGIVPYKNEVVFTKHPKGLHTASADGNTAEAVFPQNILIEGLDKTDIEAVEQLNKLARKELMKGTLNRCFHTYYPEPFGAVKND